MEKHAQYETDFETLPFALLVKKDDKLPSFYITKIHQEFSHAFASYTENKAGRSIIASTFVYTRTEVNIEKAGKCYQFAVNVTMEKTDFDAIKESPEAGKDDFEAAYSWFEQASKNAFYSLFDENVVSVAYREEIKSKLKEKLSQ